MSFFGMGPWEIMIIVVAGLIIFGPGKLPEVAGQAGRAIKDFRRMTSELSGEFEKTMADVTDAKGSLGNELKGMANQVNSVTKSVQKDLNKIGGSTTKTTKPATAKSTTASSAKSSTTTAANKTTTTAGKSTSGAAKAAPAAPAPPKVASKADPLGDMSFVEDEVLPASKPIVTPTTPSPARAAAAATTTRTASAPSTSSSTDPAIDAVARARQRRLAAGYNSHRSQ